MREAAATFLSLAPRFWWDTRRWVIVHWWTGHVSETIVLRKGSTAKGSDENKFDERLYREFKGFWRILNPTYTRRMDRSSHQAWRRVAGRKCVRWRRRPNLWTPLASRRLEYGVNWNLLSCRDGCATSIISTWSWWMHPTSFDIRARHQIVMYVPKSHSCTSNGAHSILALWWRHDIRCVDVVDHAHSGGRVKVHAMTSSRGSCSWRQYVHHSFGGFHLIIPYPETSYTISSRIESI
jgi:hypothetical protein